MSQELLPSFYADVRIAQPAVALNAAVRDSVLARAWRESTHEVCIHIIAVNIDINFHPFEMTLSGLTDTEAALATSQGLFPLFDGSCSANPGPGFRPGPGEPVSPQATRRCVWCVDLL